MTSSPNSGGFSKLGSSVAATSPPGSELLEEGWYSKKGAWQSSSHTWQYLLFHSLDLRLQWFLLQEWACVSNWLWTRGWLSHSISSSKAAAITRVLWWASLTLVRLLSLEASLLWGFLLLGGWTSVELGSPDICGVSLCSHPWQSSKEDTTSATSSGSPGGDPGSLQSLYTS